MPMATINDLYQHYSELCGEHGPQRSRDELQDEFHRRGFGRYELEGEEFLDAIFDDEWAWALE